MILDADKVDSTNINRQLIATISTVGENKCEATKRRILDINPQCEVVTICEFLDGKNSSVVFDTKPDYIIDAIDTVTSKLALAKYCYENGIKIINDAYNASYESMKASLEFLQNYTGTRKIAVLGDMFELGEFSTELHRKVGKEVVNNNIDILLNRINTINKILKNNLSKNNNINQETNN